MEAASVNSVELRAGAASLRGRVHEELGDDNEDGYLIDRQRFLFAVFDTHVRKIASCPINGCHLAGSEGCNSATDDLGHCTDGIHGASVSIISPEGRRIQSRCGLASMCADSSLSCCAH